MFVKKPIQYVRDLFRLDVARSILLGLLALLALLRQNSILDTIYNRFLDIPATLQIGAFLIGKPHNIQVDLLRY